MQFSQLVKYFTLCENCKLGAGAVACGELESLGYGCQASLVRPSVHRELPCVACFPQALLAAEQYDAVEATVYVELEYMHVVEQHRSAGLVIGDLEAYAVGSRRHRNLIDSSEHIGGLALVATPFMLLSKGQVGETLLEAQRRWCEFRVEIARVVLRATWIDLLSLPNRAEGILLLA